MAEITARGRIPLLVGGTMLYYKALLEGLANMPAADPVVRAELEAWAAAEGWEVLHRELARLDLESAARIHPNDPQRLIRALAEIDGLDRIRYTTSHPNDMADDLIEAHRLEPKLMPYLHLPVQSGSDRILKAMNRKHTVDQYLRLIDRIRDARPDIMLTSDFIVGFPGETDADHRGTLDLVRRVNFGTAFSFKYSPRPGTPAYDRSEVDSDLADARLQELQALLTSQQKAAQAGMVGRELGVLFEKPGRMPGQMVGKSDYLHAVFVEAPQARVGDLVRVRITRSAPNSLAGELAA
mgnify:CR=1 FL=1